MCASGTLRSALKLRKSIGEVGEDNFIDLVEYPNYYTLMVVNFASSLTQNIEQIFYKYFVEFKRQDIIVITMQDVVTTLELMRDDPKYADIFAKENEQHEEEEEEEKEEDEEGGEEGEEEEERKEPIEKEIPIDHIIMVIKNKIDAAIKENDRKIADRESLAKFHILEYWETGVGLSKISLPIVDEKQDSTPKTSKGKKEKKNETAEAKPKRSKKNSIDVVEKTASVNEISTDQFTYEITDYEYTRDICSKLTERGQERIDKPYIEDFPLLGPKLYIILLNFRNINLMIRLIEENFYLNTIMQILPFGVNDDQDSWNLIDMNKRRLNIFKSVSFFEHYITFSDKPYRCYADQMNAYKLICYMFYDADDIRRKHQNFLANCYLINVSDNINTFVQPSDVEFLYSNEIEFYLINLYSQIHNHNEEEENVEDENSQIQSKTEPISFTLFNNRIAIIENSYVFFMKNQSLKNIDVLSATFYDYISKMNETYFKNTTKTEIEDYNFNEIKFIKNLTKYSFNEIVFELNSISSNKKDLYQCHYYEIVGKQCHIVEYKYGKKKNCDDKLCQCYSVIPTQLCHRDFNEFLYDDILPWLKKQEFAYNNLLQDYIINKYLSALPRHIEFVSKFVKDKDFIYEPSIKMETYRKQRSEFESLKLKEYKKIFEYLDEKNAKVTGSSSIQTAAMNTLPASPDGKLSLKKPKKSNKRGSIKEPGGTERSSPPPSIIKIRRISDIQPFDDLNLEPEIEPFKLTSTAAKPDVKKVPVKAFNVFDLGDERYEIDIKCRKFHFKNGCLRHTLDDILYKEKYQSLRLRFCWNRFFINRIFLADVHDRYLLNYVRIVTENDTIINLHVNEEYVDRSLIGWTSSIQSLAESETETNYMSNVSVVLNWPNGLKIYIADDKDLNENIIMQEWCEVDGRDNESKRWYFLTGCCVVFCLNLVIMVYTAHGIIYEIGGAYDEDETVQVTENSNNYDVLEQTYEFELNYLTFLSKFIIFDHFNLLLPNGCKIFVKDGKIIKYVSEKPNKLLVKEHMDYVTGEIQIRREDGFKMLFKPTEQIVIYPDGTIIKTGPLQIIENIEETTLSDLSSVQSECDVLPKDQSIAFHLIKLVIKFATSDNFQFINRKYLHFFHENYSTINWDIDSNKISFDNYDRSLNIVYNNGSSIDGILKNNFANVPRSENVEDLKFHFDTDRMTIDHNDFSSEIHLRYADYQSNYDDRILMTTLDHELLHHVEVTCDGKVNVFKNIAKKCVDLLKKSKKCQKLLEDPIKYGDRTFLICKDKEDMFFELFMDDIKFDRKDDIIQHDDEGNILVLHNLNAMVNANFKSSSDLFARIPDLLATKSDNLCKLDDDIIEIQEKRIKLNFFNKLSNRFGFAYYQKYCDDKLIKNYYCGNKQIEMLSENGINYCVDQQFQQLIDEREAKRNRLKPSEAFLLKMREIDERHHLANTYKIMLRQNIVPKYFDFHEHGDHIKNMDISKYIKRGSKIRYALFKDEEQN